MKLVSLLTLLASLILYVKSFCIISSSRHGHKPPCLVRSQPKLYPINNVSLISSSIHQSRLHGNNNDGQTEVGEGETSWIDIVKQKPGTLVIAPFVLLFFLDIVANIIVLTKRKQDNILFGIFEIYYTVHLKLM